ncbi:dihydrofolate reductase family protein [Devosia sp. CN2-171]|uniref:dihydrofolate reductase family protein n=1 Tax=Devosia sp. CN2-171 TaxID=3400909 RepID=UPI003BF8A331
MKPHVVMHMGTSIDARIVPHEWPGTRAFGEIYERIHRDLKGDAWIVGRVTMAEFGKGEPLPIKATEAYPRATWKAPGAEAGPYAIAIDQGAKLHLNINRANGDAIVAVLTEAAPDDHLAELRRDGISYLFAGKSELDLPLALDRLAADFGIKRLLLEGGGGINGSFLSAGLIDEISLMILPVADGTTGTPTLFDRPTGPGVGLTLQSVDQLENGILHLKYAITR